MYYVKKRIEVAGAHKLSLDYESKCANLHGHNWIVTVYCKSETLNHNGMVVDFTEIKKAVMVLDHANVNEVVGDRNPTAENIARWLCERIPLCWRVEVIESENNEAAYERA